MPRGPRLDFIGALYHVIVRGIERRRIFRSQADRNWFLERLAEWIIESRAGLYAWALMPNHAHLLLRTGQLPLSTSMGEALRCSLRGWKHRERVRSGRERWAHDERVLGSREFVHTLLSASDEPAVTASEPAALIQPLVDSVCERFRVSPGELASRSLRPAVLDARAVLSYVAVMHHGLSFTEVARQVGLSRRSISRAIQRAQITGLTDAIPLPGLASPTTPP